MTVKSRLVLFATAVVFLASLVFVSVAYKDRADTFNRFQRERIERSQQLNRFLELQCQRDAVRDAILTQVIHNSIRHTRFTVSQASLRKQEIAALEQAIQVLEFVGRNCAKTIPPARVDGG